MKAMNSLKPDQIEITPIQAKRLSTMSGVPAKELLGQTIQKLSEKFRFDIDPSLFLFRKICGKVVKKDPVTGIEYPVPYATVNVEDTDCSVLGFFPSASKYAWYFPFFCHREVIGTVKTDRCGKFCVYIPRWDIDWILKWRAERVCFPYIFDRPSLADILQEELPHFPDPIPGPDPAPFLKLDRAHLLSTVEKIAGGDAARRMGTELSRLSFGAQSNGLTQLLQEDAFSAPLPPPLPRQLRQSNPSAGKKFAASQLPIKEVRSALGEMLRLPAEKLEKFDLSRFIGPFRRCHTVLIPEWTPIFDIPDITFHVTQDVNGDGVEESIYSEGHFNVRWNAGPLSPVTLVASSTAISVPSCDDTTPIACGNVPAIYRAGRMPVRGDATMYDPAAGYAVRPNRPHPTGNPADPLPNPAAETPFHGVVPVYGCVDVGTAATHYRLRDSFEGGPSLPMLNHSWWVTRLDASGTVTQYHHVVPDADGWYPIVIPKGTNPNDWEPEHLLLDWNTSQSGNGKHVLKIELGAGGVALSPQPASDTVAFHVDNSYPVTSFQVEYRKNGVGPFLPLTFPCPVVNRGVTAQDVEFRVTFSASSLHLRDAMLSSSGCGAGNIVLQSFSSGELGDDWFPSASGVAHWHETPNDNSAVVTAFFTLDASASQGTYSFGAWAASRAMNPAGGDAGHLAVPMYEYDPAGIHVTPSYSFSVINAD